MRRKIYALTIALTLVLPLVLPLVSCASLRAGRDQRSVKKISTLINERDAAALIGMSATPFLLDREIILLPRDIETLWNNITTAGFTIESPVLEEGRPLEPGSYRRFADTMEVRTFFSKYLPAGTRLLELQSGSGRKMLFLVRRRFLGPRRLYGFKGPY